MQPTIELILTGNYTFKNRVKYFLRFVKWQFVSKIFKRTLTYSFTQNSKLTLFNGYGALTGNYYFGLQEPDIMPFVLHFLRENDLFVDLGANGGSFTVLASAEKKAFTIAVEASPETFQVLLKNIEVNHIENIVEVLNVAVSDKNGVLPFTKSDKATNRISLEQTDDTILIEAKTLDDILGDRIPVLIKMDIEGHEHNALLGAHKALSSEKCKVIIAEFSNTGEYYGYGNIHTHKLLQDYGFQPFKYDYITKELIALESPSEFNMIYIKDEPFVFNRLKMAQRTFVGNEII